MTDQLQIKVSGGVARVTFNRPEARNALSPEMRTALVDSMIDFGQDDSIRCIVIAGAGENFMAGGDVKNFAELAKSTVESFLVRRLRIRSSTQ